MAETPRRKASPKSSGKAKRAAIKEARTMKQAKKEADTRRPEPQAEAE
ncbi:hypothetical protein J5X84_01145 [Streptosporangiaceae bacterium NEAU-GS5]|nr:hypothetical protein [Streptosporangiaceae bacterium NEAU-GS5]